MNGKESNSCNFRQMYVFHGKVRSRLKYKKNMYTIRIEFIHRQTQIYQPKMCFVIDRVSAANILSLQF